MSIYIELILAAILVAGGAAAGYTWEHRALEAANAKHAAEIATMQADANARVAAANVLAEKASQNAATSVAVAAASYEKEKLDAQAANDARIASLLSGNSRLRVAVNIATHTIHSLAVPGTPADSSGTESASSATLTGPVAGRLAGRYAAYNDLASRLNLCESVLERERQALGNVTTDASTASPGGL